MGIKFGTGDNHSIGIFGGAIGLWPSSYLAVFLRRKVSSSPQNQDTFLNLYAGPGFSTSVVFTWYWSSSATNGFDMVQGSENTTYRWNNVAPANDFSTDLICWDMTDSSVAPSLYHNGEFVSATTVSAGAGIDRWTSNNRSGMLDTSTNLLPGCSHEGVTWIANNFTFYEVAIFCSHKPLGANFADLLVKQRVHPLSFTGCVGYIDWRDYPQWQNQALARRCRGGETTKFNSGTVLPSFVQDEPPYFSPFCKSKNLPIVDEGSYDKFWRMPVRGTK